MFDFTVILPIYYKTEIEKLDLAVQSIFKNSISPLETIIIVDGIVSDQILKKLEFYVMQEKKIKLIFNSKNLGLAQTLNKAISYVKTDWFIRCDHDDISYRDRFEKLINFIQINNLLFASSYIEETDDNSKFVNLKKVPLKHNEILKYAKYRNPINHNASIYNTKAVLSVNGYPDISYQDYGLNIKLLSSNFKCGNINLVLVRAGLGHDFFKRRSGFKIAFNEIELLKIIRSYKFHNIYESLTFLIIRFTFNLLPVYLLKLVYRKLRN